MIRSMTGFGAAQISADGWTVSAECRSVNQKALEVKVYLPRQISTFEPHVLESIKSVVRRGRVDVRFELQRESGTQTAVDEARFAEIANTLKHLAESNRLAPPVVSDVLSFREVHVAGDTQETVGAEILAQVTQQAVAQLVSSRSEEGNKLAQTVRHLVEQIETLVGVVEASGPRLSRSLARGLRRVSEMRSRNLESPRSTSNAWPKKSCCTQTEVISPKKSSGRGRT
ncbi:MAG: YicC/YloC family endoribonuclease [bacterium]